jgi:long-chain acyl-CoA synthetase
VRQTPAGPAAQGDGVTPVRASRRTIEGMAFMEKPWLRSYPPNIPAEIDTAAFASLAALMAPVFAAWPDRAAFVNQGASLSYHRFDQLARDFSAYLQHGAGLHKGERVAIMMPNLLQYPIALFGALGAGCVAVNTNPLYTARELQRQLVDSGASCIVVLENFAHVLQQVLPATSVRTVITTRVGDMLHLPRALLTNFVLEHVKHMVPEWHRAGALASTAARRRGAAAPATQASAAGTEPALLQYTGGTTGVPKAAVLTHANLVANVLQTEAWVRDILTPGHEIAVIPLPLYHIFALTCMLTFMRLAATNVLVTNPRDLPAFIKEIKHAQPSIIIGVNTLFRALLDAPGVEDAATGTLKLAVAGGMAVQRGVAESWQQRFGVPVTEGYGLTETSPIVCANRLDAGQFTGAIGLPIPSTEVAVLDDAGAPLPTGETGEICVRGPQVMQGYWNNPEETAHVFAPGGWLRTGDIGNMDEQGYFRILDRKKDMIIVSGFKVFPNEVEEVATMHPGVLEAVAVGAPDERAGQVVKLVVVRKDPQLSEADLIAHCKLNLTAYKVPKMVVFRDQPLPKSNIGKILRRVVSEQENGAAAGSS